MEDFNLLVVEKHDFDILDVFIVTIFGVYGLSRFGSKEKT